MSNNVQRIELPVSTERAIRMWDDVLQHNCFVGEAGMGMGSRVSNWPARLRMFSRPGARCYPALMDFLPGHEVRRMFDSSRPPREFYAGVLHIIELPHVNTEHRTASGNHPPMCTHLGDGWCFLFIPDGWRVNTGLLMMMMLGRNKGDCLILT